MKSYAAVSGLIFFAIFAAHIARIVAEKGGPLREPIFIASSSISLGMVVWSLAIFFKRKL